MEIWKDDFVQSTLYGLSSHQPEWKNLKLFSIVNTNVDLGKFSIVNTFLGKLICRIFNIM